MVILRLAIVPPPGRQDLVAKQDVLALLLLRRSSVVVGRECAFSVFKAIIDQTLKLSPAF